MEKFRTHYDNLKVSRNASALEIRESYKRLSIKYHPDRNQNNSDASRIMAILNSSYEVLSDPIQRKHHDEWIKEKETDKKSHLDDHRLHFNYQEKYKRQYEVRIVHIPKTKAYTNISLFAKYLSFSMVGIFVWFFYISNKDIDPFIGRNSYVALPESSPFINVASLEHVFERPPLAPNGKTWPAKAGYLLGYDKLNTSGKSSITIDNTKNDSDVHVKLALIDSYISIPIRQIYIPAYRKFKVDNITAGFYDIRYRDLTTDRLSKSEPFLLEESETEGKIKFSDLTITLPRVQHNGIEKLELAEAEF